MKLTYAHRKRIKSLAARYLRTYDSLVEAKELNEFYHSDFVLFVENLLIDLCGLKKHEPKPKVYRPGKVGTRPPRRKPGQRPLRIGEEIVDAGGNLTKYKELEKKIEDSVDPQKPSWYKKAWRKIMLQVHPDRLDMVSKDELDKLSRHQIAARLRNDSGSELIIASCNTLELDIELSSQEQERMLRVSTNKLQKELKDMSNTVPWLWAESIVDNPGRVQLIKQVLHNSGIKPPEDMVLTQYVIKNKE